MNTLRAWVKRQPLITFVILAYLLSWSSAIPMKGMLLPWGPALAALIVVSLTGGKAAVKAWWRGVIRRPRARSWYLVAALLPLGLNLAAAGLNLLLGATITQTIDWRTPFLILPVMLIVSGMWEEPGWTGFALPHVQERFAAMPYGTLIATLIMAVIRTGWHLPLMLTGHIYWSDIVAILAVQIVISGLFNASGSVLVIMLLHLVNNIIAGEFVMQWFAGADWVRLAWLQAGLWSLVAIAVLLWSGLRLGQEADASRQKEPLGAPALNPR